MNFWYMNSSAYYSFHIDYIKVYHTASTSRNMWHNWESEQSLCIILWVCSLGKEYTLIHVLDWQDIGKLRLTMPFLFRYSNRDTIHEKKKDNLDFIKVKNFCFEKKFIKRMKRKVTDWEKILSTWKDPPCHLSTRKCKLQHEISLNGQNLDH